jgi:hypothetical protein
MNGIPQAVLDLRDVHAPPPPAFWPPAPGWWVLAALMTALGAYLGVRLYRIARIRRQRRQVLAALDTLVGQYGPGEATRFAAEVSMLLRRVALARFPRHEVASLVGEAWLRFLDRTGGGTGFTEGPGTVLALGPYCRSAELDAEALATLAKDWVTKNAA